MSHEQINQHLSNWTDRESTAEAMIPLIGRLYRKNNVVTSVYGRAIINQSDIDIVAPIVLCVRLRTASCLFTIRYTFTKRWTSWSLAALTWMSASWR